MELGWKTLKKYLRRYPNAEIFNILKGAARALEQFHQRKYFIIDNLA